MIGFALIIIVVAVILLVFVGFFLRDTEKESVESYEVESFIQSFLHYTSDCRDNLEFLSIQKLILDCNNDRLCLDQRKACDVLTPILEEITEESCIIVVEISQGTQAFQTGIVVDHVQEVLDIDGSDIEDAPQFGSSVNTDFILGMGKIKDTVKKYSDFIAHPIVMDIEREKESKLDKTQKVKVKEEETLNSRKAIWLKNKSDITETEYNEFYKHVSHDFTDPAKVIHYKAEGASEFTSLLYIPSMKPVDIYYKEYKIGPTLYVKRVKIMDHCEELIPPYLRFVKGVVDSSDLPLNVSREILQNNRQVEVIKKSIIKKVLDTLRDMKEKEFDKYVSFYNEFGRVLKEGVHMDFDRRETIGELLIFPSTKTEKDKYRTIPEYVDNMKEGQEDIYYITGTSLDETLKSPYLEAFKEKDFEVLIMLDDIDDVIMSSFEYKGKKFKSAIKGDVTLDKSEKEKKEKAGKKYRKLLDLINDRLDDVKEVRLSGRLKDSACCLVGDEGEMDPQMEKLLKSMGQDVPERKRILEINPTHPIFEAMNRIFEEDRKSKVLEDYTDLLYNQALLLEGSKPKDSAAFAKAISKLMVENVQHVKT